MPVPLTYPGVYIEEIPSGVRTIVGVATSITAFVGRAQRGVTDEPIRIQSFADYERLFGGLWEPSTMSYAVQQFFLNGGTDAIIVRVHVSGQQPTIDLGGGFILQAANPGDWGNQLEALVDYNTKDPSDTSMFNLTVREKVPGAANEYRFVELFRNVSVTDTSTRFVRKVLEQESMLVRVETPGALTRPAATANAVAATTIPNADGSQITDAAIATGAGLEAAKKGMYALLKADLFNLLCIPPLARDTDIAAAVRDAAAKFAADRRAMYIADPPLAWSQAADPVSTAETGVSDSTNFMARNKNAAAFFPHIKAQDPLKENRLEAFAPCGAVAGIFSRTDVTRGVWKAPAGLEATVLGARELSYKLSDAENGRLNPLGLNCLRTFPVTGNVVWGARTLEGADLLASEWKYIPVRRTALYIEESLYRGTQWVVFEPNDEPLWAQIRLNVGAFMQDLFRQGAFQGQSPREAYFVKCDKDTTTQSDINKGIVNILVGFAPLKPAEFVVIKIQQMAGQIAA
ncbi:MAG: phage tail sheath family protein [Bryobacterales bacterium]|nr:phage tail sheath family protein [Bryobacterales bacterium]